MQRGQFAGLWRGDEEGESLKEFTSAVQSPIDSKYGTAYNAKSILI